ncbi:MULTISPECIES: SlyX family protein [unclassified Moraxella]|uniref:SlyX family protein n=1 Tax=unclassified Moraxella TaxID=2685852 RepID=UPI002B40A0E2|nr:MULTISPECIES: SlyX family protein [unclassified Moraxella]
MTDMHTQLIDLQIKITYLENTVDTLNDVIATQDRQLKNLQDQLKIIYKDLQNNHDDDGIAPFDLLVDRPPHY